MKKISLIVFVFYIFLLSLSVCGETLIPKDIFKSAEKNSYILYYRGWGTLSAVCSAGAIFSDEKIIRILTAGHCIALVQKEKGKNTEFVVTKDGLNFISSRIIATGWKPKEDSFSIPFNFLLDFNTEDLDYNTIADTKDGDWAVLEIDNIYNSEAVNIVGTSEGLELGDKLYSVGFPQAGDKIAAEGIIANISYSTPSLPWDKYIAMNIAASPGSSGSVIFNDKGFVIGVLVAGIGNGMLHLATPIDIVKKKLPCINQHICKNPTFTKHQH